MQDNIEQEFLGCIPSLPEVAAQFITLSKELSPIKRSCANLLLSDAVLSTMIFTYINTVLNSQKLKYLSINKGISLMGLQKFKNVVLVFSLYPIFYKAACIPLFKHSLLVACYSKDIASGFNLINPDDAFLLGFLHDIGKIAMKNKFGERYSSYCSEKKEEIFSVEKELKEFNHSHSDVSECVCKNWMLPAVITDSIKFHHFPLQAMLPQAASIVNLADMFASGNLKTPVETQKVLQYLQISKSEAASYITDSQRKIEPYFEILNV